MRESQNKRVWEYLLKHGKITAYEMFKKFNICHPPARIRDLRKKYGYDFIKDRWIEKPIKVLKNGKETNITQRFKEYFIAEDKKELAYGFKQ